MKFCGLKLDWKFWAFGECLKWFLNDFWNLLEIFNDKILEILNPEAFDEELTGI